jgi:ornithine cyclodeaminase
VLLHSGETGELLAVMNAAAITAIRTAAVSAVATKLLSRPDSTRLAIIGAGVQARKHLEAMRCVRNIKGIKIFSRSGAKGLGQEAASVEEAVSDADIIVTATSAREPVLLWEWVRPGTHINAVGSSIPTTRELSSSVVASASLFVDRRESAVRESGDYLFALQDGAIRGPEHIKGELGELLLGRVAGRQSNEEVTLFKSLGLAIEDVAAAAHLYEKARELGSGTWVEF